MMKRIFTLCAIMCTLLNGFAQTDTIPKPAPDTIRVGSMIIIREKGSKPQKEDDGPRIRDRKDKDKRSNISTNWWIIDLGFSNVTDNTVYGPGTAANAFAPGSNSDWFKLRFGKSSNVNIWFFMQRLNIAAHVVNLKYGIGLELNNYRFDDTRVKFSKNPTMVSLDQNLVNARKNKLAADYLTVPMMLNFNFTPDRRHEGFGFSAGVSAGVLYASRQKTKVGGDVSKSKDDFDLERWKLSYIGELSLGPVKLYGSYAVKNMWAKGLDQTPYTVGFRFSRW